MTAIAVRLYPDLIRVATDSAVTYDGSSAGLVTHAEKFSKVGRVWFGGAGDDADITAFHAHLEERPFPERVTIGSAHKWLTRYYAERRKSVGRSDRKERGDPDFLIVVSGRVLLCSGMSIEECTQYAAIGTGDLACYVAMDLGHDPADAVDAACRRVEGCRPPVRRYEIKRRR